MSKKEKEVKMEEKSIENPFENFKILDGPSVDSFDDTNSEASNEVNEEIEEPIVEKEVKVPKAKIEKSTSKKTEEEELKAEEAKYFESKKKTEVESIEEEVEESEEFSFKPLVEHLASKNILDIPEGEEFDDSEEYLEKLVDNTATKRAEEKYNSFYESLPEDGKELLDFMSKGGDPKEFVNVYYNQGSYKNVNLDNEETQKAIIRDGLKLAGWDEDSIEDEVKDAEDLGKLETKSKMFLTKLQKAEDEQKAELIKNQEAIRNNQVKQQEEYWNNLKSELDKKTEINGFPLTDKIKAQVWDHMSKPVDKKTGKTQLMVNNEKNKDAQYLYAYLDMMNWDISKLEKSVKTKVTSELRKNLNKFTDSRAKIGRQGKTEYTEEKENTFEGFKTLFGA